MDSGRFDKWVRGRANLTTRRSVLAKLGLIASSGALGAIGLRSSEAEAACRANGSICREDANCCSEYCNPDGPHGRSVCDCPPGTVEESGVCKQLVVAVYDGTDVAECEQTLSTDDGPDVPVPCTTGTVLYTEPMTEDAAIAAGYTNYVVMTGDSAVDEAAILQATDGLADLLHPEGPSGQATCTFKRFRFTGSYKMKNANYRAQYELAFVRNTNCTITQMIDRSKAGQGGYGLIRWVKSCANSGSNCSNRNITLYSNYTGTHNVPNSAVGKTYRHYSWNLADCRTGACSSANGYWKFESTD